MSGEILVKDDPVGYNPSASGSGLLLPSDLSRERETWTRDERRLIERVLKLMRSRKLAVVLKCNDERCKGAEIVPEMTPGGFTWTCPHAVRHFHRQV